MGTDVDCLIDGTTYSFIYLLARTFQGKKQLSAPKHVAIEKQLDDGSTDVVSAESFDSVSDSPRTIKMQRSLHFLSLPRIRLVSHAKQKLEAKSAKGGLLHMCHAPAP